MVERQKRLMLVYHSSSIQKLGNFWGGAQEQQLNFYSSHC